MIRKAVVIIALLLATSVSLFAQRMAFVDSEFILKHMPEYNSAIKELNAMSKQWQAEMDEMDANIVELQKVYAQDKTILTAEMRKARESEIVNKQQEARKYQQEKFGPEGSLFQLRTQLIKPIQNRVAAAIKQVAEDRRMDIIFDKNSEASSIMYGAPNYDFSKLVIEKMGYKMNVKDKFNSITNQ